MHCHFYIPIRTTLFDNLKEVVNNLQELSDQTVTEMLLYGSLNLKGNQNSQILELPLSILWIQRGLLVLCFSGVALFLFFFGFLIMNRT